MTRPGRQPSQVIGIMLENYTYEVFDKRGFEVQNWDYISPETVLLEYRGHPVRKRLKRAILDARFLVDVKRQGEQRSSRLALDDFEDVDVDRWAAQTQDLAVVSVANKITPRSCSAESGRDDNAWVDGDSSDSEARPRRCDTAVRISDTDDDDDSVRDRAAPLCAKRKADKRRAPHRTDNSAKHHRPHQDQPLVAPSST